MFEANEPLDNTRYTISFRWCADKNRFQLNQHYNEYIWSSISILP